MNHSINDEAVYRTAPAKPGLLNIYNELLYKGNTKQLLNLDQPFCNIFTENKLWKVF